MQAVNIFEEIIIFKILKKSRTQVKTRTDRPQKYLVCCSLAFSETRANYT